MIVNQLIPSPYSHFSLPRDLPSQSLATPLDRIDLSSLLVAFTATKRIRIRIIFHEQATVLLLLLLLRDGRGENYCKLPPYPQPYTILFSSDVNRGYFFTTNVHTFAPNRCNEKYIRLVPAAIRRQEVHQSTMQSQYLV